MFAHSQHALTHIFSPTVKKIIYGTKDTSTTPAACHPRNGIAKGFRDCKVLG